MGKMEPQQSWLVEIGGGWRAEFPCLFASILPLLGSLNPPAVTRGKEEGKVECMHFTCYFWAFFLCCSIQSKFVCKIWVGNCGLDWNGRNLLFYLLLISNYRSSTFHNSLALAPHLHLIFGKYVRFDQTLKQPNKNIIVKKTVNIT